MAAARHLLLLLVAICALQAVLSAPSNSRRSRRMSDQDEAQDESLTEESSPSRSRRGKVVVNENVEPEGVEETKPKDATKKRSRHNKALNFFGFIPKFFSSDLDYGDDDDNIEFGTSNDAVHDSYEDLSRTIPPKRKQNKNNGNYPVAQSPQINSLQYDSPIFYIRMPPTPYMFVPGLGYVSQPPSISPAMAQPVNPFINVPIDFVSNGKPTGVYEWSDPGYEQQNPYLPVFPQQQKPIKKPINNYNIYQKPARKPSTDTKLTSLKGQYAFNGKPSSSVFVLRDSYNSLYADALQNFYP